MLKLLQQTGYERDDIRRTLETALHDFAPLRQPAEQRRSVLLKPNFVVPGPRHDAATTHPDFYMALADLLMARGFKVGIGESPALGSCRSALKAHDVLEECHDKGIAVVEFKQPQFYAGVSDEKHFRQLTIARELSHWDAIINLPKLKTHCQFTFTGATKNLYGCVTGKRKFVRHNLCGNNPVRFARMILANAKKANCLLHIGDGIEALHVRGPMGGQNFPLGKIIVSDDALTHDWLFCQLTALDPLSTPLFKAVDKTSLRRIEQVCADITEQADFKPAADFVHAPLVDISFSPWRIMRSGLSTLRYKVYGAT